MKPPPIDESTLVFRRPGPDDADALAALYNDPAVYPGLMQLPYTDAAYWRQRNAQPSDGAAAQSLTLVVLHGSDLVAAGCIYPTGFTRRRHVVSLGMAVGGAWQGRGVGTALLTRLLNYADRWLGVTRVELSVYTDNAPAIALYRRHGFEVEGTQRASVLREGVLIDVLMMARLAPRVAAS